MEKVETGAVFKFVICEHVQFNLTNELLNPLNTYFLIVTKTKELRVT